MENIANGLISIGSPLEVRRSRRMAGFRFEHLKLIMKSNVILLHTPLLMSCHYAFWARLLGKTVVSIVWDSYPVTLGGLRFDRSIRRRLFDLVENAALSLSNRLLVPSPDFRERSPLKRAEPVRLWYMIRVSDLDLGSLSPRSDDEPLKVLFAGQINRTRGLVAAVGHLHRLTQGRFQLLIASGDPLPLELSEQSGIHYLGRLDRDDLRRVAAGCDCGLVSLASDFDGPGLPSKTFEYLEAGIPCLYYGKRLRHYLEMLEQSGAGIEIGGRTSLKRGDVLAKKANISRAASCFSRSFALNVQELLIHLEPIRK